MYRLKWVRVSINLRVTDLRELAVKESSAIMSALFCSLQSKVEVYFCKAFPERRDIGRSAQPTLEFHRATPCGNILRKTSSVPEQSSFDQLIKRITSFDKGEI
jgi:hypothetical protein